MFIYINPLVIQNFLGFKKKKVIAIYEDFELKQDVTTKSDSLA